MLYTESNNTFKDKSFVWYIQNKISGWGKKRFYISDVYLGLPPNYFRSSSRIITETPDGAIVLSARSPATDCSGNYSWGITMAMDNDFQRTAIYVEGRQDKQFLAWMEHIIFLINQTTSKRQVRDKDGSVWRLLVTIGSRTRPRLVSETFLGKG